MKNIFSQKFFNPKKCIIIFSIFSSVFSGYNISYAADAPQSNEQQNSNLTPQHSLSEASVASPIKRRSSRIGLKVTGDEKGLHTARPKSPAVISHIPVNAPDDTSALKDAENNSKMTQDAEQTSVSPKEDVPNAEVKSSAIPLRRQSKIGSPLSFLGFQSSKSKTTTHDGDEQKAVQNAAQSNDTAPVSLAVDTNGAKEQGKTADYADNKPAAEDIIVTPRRRQRHSTENKDQVVVPSAAQDSVVDSTKEPSKDKEMHSFLNMLNSLDSQGNLSSSQPSKDKEMHSFLNMLDSLDSVEKSNIDDTVSSGDLDVFYPTPKSRRIADISLRRIAADVGDRLAGRSLEERDVSAAPAAGDAGNISNVLGLWGSTNLDKTRSGGQNSATKTKNFTKTLGFDIDIGKVLLGAAISSSKGRTIYIGGDSDGDKIKNKTTIFALYGNFDLNRDMFIKTLASYGVSNLHSYSDNPGYGIAQSKYKQKLISLQAELGHSYKWKLINQVISGGIRYVHTKTPEHNEWGAGIMNKTTKKDTSDDFEFIASAALNKLIQIKEYKIIPNVVFSVRKRFAGQNPTAVYIRSDSPNEFSLSSPMDKKLYAQIASGVQTKYKSTSLNLKAHCGFGKKYKNLGGTLTFRVEI